MLAALLVHCEEALAESHIAEHVVHDGHALLSPQRRDVSMGVPNTKALPNKTYVSNRAGDLPRDSQRKGQQKTIKTIRKNKTQRLAQLLTFFKHSRVTRNYQVHYLSGVGGEG